MPRKKRESKMRDRELTNNEYWEMLLGGSGSEYENVFLKRASWTQHREELLSLCPVGVRPDAWWEFEAPAGDYTRHDHESEEDFLRRHKLLEPWEEAQLEAEKKIRGEG